MSETQKTNIGQNVIEIESEESYRLAMIAAPFVANGIPHLQAIREAMTLYIATEVYKPLLAKEAQGAVTQLKNDTIKSINNTCLLTLEELNTKLKVENKLVQPRTIKKHFERIAPFHPVNADAKARWLSAIAGEKVFNTKEVNFILSSIGKRIPKKPVKK